MEVFFNPLDMQINVAALQQLVQLQSQQKDQADQAASKQQQQQESYTTTTTTQGGGSAHTQILESNCITDLSTVQWPLLHAGALNPFNIKPFLQQQIEQQNILSYFIQQAALNHQKEASAADVMPGNDSLPGTSADNPLPSYVIGMATAVDGSGVALNPSLHDAKPRRKVRKTRHAADPSKSSVPLRSLRGPRDKDAERSSKFRGVTKHKRSGRYEAHIWVKDVGRQVYLGGYSTEEHAAEAYDIATLKVKGVEGVKTNFELSKYEELLGCIDRMTMEELVMAVRRQSQGFSRGSSSFRGVTKHPSGRYEARIGIPGSKHIYLGLFPDEKQAAKVYDQSLVRLRGRSSATNFSLTSYEKEMAEYHKFSAKILEKDPRYLAINDDINLLEKWVKGGAKGMPELEDEKIAVVQAAGV